MTSYRRNPYVFVVGCPRSGTALLQRMLDAHPFLAVASDTHFIARAVEAVTPRWRTDPGAIAAAGAELRAWSRAHHRFPRLGLAPEAVERAAAPADGFAPFVRRLYDELGAMHGKPYGGEQTPDYVVHLPLLRALFPSARFIHLLRDGRDVALSLLDWARPDRGPGGLRFWSQDPLAVAALWWSERVEAGLRDGAALGDRYLEVRYEELVAAPERVLRRIARFLDLPFAAEMLSFDRGRERNTAGLSAMAAAGGPAAGQRDWRSQLDIKGVELFEALAGETLVAAGYACQTRRPGARGVARADRARRAWSGIGDSFRIARGLNW
jgi:hypothetical protein